MECLAARNCGLLQIFGRLLARFWRFSPLLGGNLCRLATRQGLLSKREGCVAVRLDRMFSPMDSLTARLKLFAARLVGVTFSLERLCDRLDTLPTTLCSTTTGHGRRIDGLERLSGFPPGLTADSHTSPSRPHRTQARKPLAPLQQTSLIKFFRSSPISVSNMFAEESLLRLYKSI